MRKELKIVNKFQVVFYVEHGFQPERIEIGYGGVLVFIYDKEKTYDVFGKWCDHCKEYRARQAELENII